MEECGSRGAGDRGVEPGQRHPPGHGAAWPRRARLRPVRVRRLGSPPGLSPPRRPLSLGGCRHSPRPRQRERLRAPRGRPPPRRGPDDGRPPHRSGDRPSWPPPIKPSKERATAALRRPGPSGGREPADRVAGPTFAMRARRLRFKPPHRPVSIDGQGFVAAVLAAFHDEHERLSTATATGTGTTWWSSGSTCGCRRLVRSPRPEPQPRSSPRRRSGRAGPNSDRRSSTVSGLTPPIYRPGRHWAQVTSVAGPAIDRGVRLDDAGPARLHRHRSTPFGNLVVKPMSEMIE